MKNALWFIDDKFCCGGYFACIDWVPLSPWSEGSLKINTKLLWVITFILQWNSSILMGVASSRRTVLPSIMHEWSLDDLKSMKIIWIICYSPYSFNLHLSTDTYVWAVCEHSAPHHHQNTEWGNMFRKNGVQSLYETCIIIYKMIWKKLVALYWKRDLMFIFTLICYICVCKTSQNIDFVNQFLDTLDVLHKHT